MKEIIRTYLNRTYTLKLFNDLSTYMVKGEIESTITKVLTELIIIFSDEKLIKSILDEWVHENKSIIISNLNEFFIGVHIIQGTYKYTIFNKMGYEMTQNLFVISFSNLATLDYLINFYESKVQEMLIEKTQRELNIYD